MILALRKIRADYQRLRRSGWHALHRLVRRLWAIRVRRNLGARAKRYLAAARRQQRHEGGPDAAILAAYLDKWSVFGRPVDPVYYRMYHALSGVDSADYVPDDIYYTIVEPTLNDYRLGLAYADKSLSDVILQSDAFPVTVARNIGGKFYDAELGALADEELDQVSASYDRLVVKPSLETGSGRLVQVFSRRDGVLRTKSGETLTAAGLLASHGSNFVIQEYLEQHDYYRALNPTSVNGFRLTTYRSVVSDEVAVLAARLKIGGHGEEVDNWHAGGVFCALDLSGQPAGRGLDENCRWHETIPASGIGFSDLGPLPAFKEACELARRTAVKMRYSRILGFDMCVDRDGRPRIMEINNRFIGMFSHQCAGGGVFQEYTDEVIAYCRTHSPAVVGVFI